MAKAEYRSAIRSRKLINAALADLLQEKPLDKITVTDVVNRAEINRGTFYAHYADIPDVIDKLIQQTFSQLREAVVSQPRTLGSVSGVLLDRIQEILEEDLDFYRKIINSSASSVMIDRLVEVVMDFLLEQEASQERKTNSRFLLTVRFCAGGLSNLYRDWFGGKLDISLEELTANARELLQTIIGGLE